MKRITASLILAVLVLTACKGIFSTPIKKIIDNPRDFDGRTVTISGKVKEVFAFFFIKYFTVDDGTAEITVVTKRPLPKKGSNVRITGKVREMFALGETETLVIVENDDGKPNAAAEP